MRSQYLAARSIWTLTLCLFVLFMAGCATTGDNRRHDYGDSNTFPVPPEIQDNVDFWRHVYGSWSRRQVAFHDQDHLGVIYEVAKIPGPVQASYTRSQKAWLKARSDDYAKRLAELEQHVRTNQRLTQGEKDLLDRFKAVGGTKALAGASSRVRTQRGMRERFRRGVEISGRYDQIFRDIMRKHGVPEDLAYLPHVESSFQTNARSSVGAGGVWQFMPSTGRQYMQVDRKVDERFDPILAADGAARYLAQAYRKLGSWPLAITSYNHGQGGMANAKATYGNDIGRIVARYRGPYFGFASRNFYAEFIAAREVASHPRRYFPEGIRYESPWPHDRLVLHHSMPASHLAEHYHLSKYRLASLNKHWRDSVVKGDTYLPVGTTVWLPEGTKQRIASLPPPVAAPTVVAKRTPSIGSIQTRTAVAKAKVSVSTKPKSQSSKAAPLLAKAKSSSKPRLTKARYHVVKPQETLYRVAVQNGISVAELRKLNKMHPDDTHIQPGQKLIVGI